MFSHTFQQTHLIDWKVVSVSQRAEQSSQSRLISTAQVFWLSDKLIFVLNDLNLDTYDDTSHTAL